MKIRPNLFLLPALWLMLLASCHQVIAQKRVMGWDFENIKNSNVLEPATQIADTIEGYFNEVEGVKGQGLLLDGSTTRVIRQGKDIKKPGSEFTIEAWVALGEYPLSWSPVITTESDEVKGYRLMIGPYGQVSFETAISEQWVTCTSARETIPLRKWMHIACVYKENMALYVNGSLASTVAIESPLTFPKKADCILGMVARPQRPSNTIRTWGTIETYFGLDGIIDEVEVFDQALSADQVKGDFLKVTPKAPAIKPRRLPVVKNNPARFGAYYTKLDYFPGWDNLWPVDDDPDIVVCFDNNPARLIFWRGIRYGPSWVSENENWMTDQSLETWGVGKNDIEGCFEHMQDRHCRFSHVRIIENNEARVVVHWRYAPVSAHDHTWMPDPKTGWECWVDEYYYIYPDGSAIRKVSWNKGSTGKHVQYQETLPITQAGQGITDLLENDYVNVADYNGNNNKRAISVDKQQKEKEWAGNYTVQRINFKSELKPFICFEPENHMWVRWIGEGYNHFPINQARSDGRWAKMSDRPTHILSSPCSNPIIHEKGNRQYWNGLYGMNNMSMEELISFGRSWVYAPGLSIESKGFVSLGYDKSQRCYLLEKNTDKAGPIEFILEGSKESPVINPAFIVKNWNSRGAKILVNGKENKDNRTGINHQLSGDELVVYLPLKEEKQVRISISEI